MSTPTPEETLTKAAEYIREHGWQQGAMGGGGGPACLMGGLREAAEALIPNPKRGYGYAAGLRRDRLVSKARRLLEERIKACFPRTQGAREGIVVFNDAKGRKVEQIMKVLDGGCELQS